jgi:hypothetical protein
MLEKFKIGKEESDYIVSIAEFNFPEYNKIRMSLDGIIEMYVNHKGHQSFSDYALPYDRLDKVHWFEFMTKVLIDKDIIPDYIHTEYVMDIFRGVHPIEAYKIYKK